ncbi:MAG TPA: hypothetical protein ENN55_01775, partial [Firmicutes bacterium]|nr:hypothetical protein [Bacillota bacterium]
MKKKLLFPALFILVFAVLIYSENLAIDPDIRSGEYTETSPDIDMGIDDYESEELPVSESAMNESSPAMPSAALKSIYFGDVKISAALALPAMDDFNDLAGENGFQKISYALSFDIVLGYKISEFLSLGPKIGFIKGISDGVTTNDSAEINLIPAAGGLTGGIFLADNKLRVSAGIYGGYAFVNGKITEYVPIAEASQAAELSGNGIYADGFID